MACGAVQGAEEERRERGGQGGRGGRDVEEDEDEVAEDQREIEGVLVQESVIVLKSVWSWESVGGGESREASS